MGVKTHPMGSLWSYYQTPNPLNGQNPLTFSQQLPFLAFFELFLPTAWARPKISQHLLTKILESVIHNWKSLNLKYYHHTTPRSVDFVFKASVDFCICTFWSANANATSCICTFSSFVACDVQMQMLGDGSLFPQLMLIVDF